MILGKFIQMILGNFNMCLHYEMNYGNEDDKHIFHKLNDFK